MNGVKYPSDVKTGQETEPGELGDDGRIASEGGEGGVAAADPRRREELFVKNPYEAVTLRMIAERAEYTAPTILNHFGSKEGLIFAICEEDFRALRERFERIARVADPVERLREIGLAYVEFAMGNPNQYRFMFMTPHPVPMLPTPRSTGATRTRMLTRSSARRSPKRSRRGGFATTATTPTWSPRCSGAGSMGWCSLHLDQGG